MNKENKMQEIQILEQSIQNLFMQKQAFQMELAEIQSALKELEKSGEEVFKIIGQLMIRTDKSAMRKELVDKEKMLILRINSFEKQESIFIKKLESLRKEILEK